MPERSDDGDAVERAAEELPAEVADEAERLTRLARNAVDENEAAAYREDRDSLLAEHGYEARIRDAEEGGDATLVCYPSAWMADGVVQVDRIEDVDRGVERSLEGVGDGDWEAVAAANDAIADRVAADHGDPHGATARALADFASNHYAKPIGDLTPAERREFVEEYFPRNAWPSDAQRDAIEDSLAIVVEESDAVPGDPP